MAYVKKITAVVLAMFLYLTLSPLSYHVVERIFKAEAGSRG
jgi:hypothetical protein